MLRTRAQGDNPINTNLLLAPTRKRGKPLKAADSKILLLCSTERKVGILQVSTYEEMIWCQTIRMTYYSDEAIS